MYISLSQVRQSLQALVPYHPFFGITFLACKAINLPVGRATEVSLDAEELKFMEMYYKPDKSSTWFFRVFRPSSREQHWLRQDYPSSGSQSTRTKRGFGDAFIHELTTNLWGWQTNYVPTLSRMLGKRGGIPAFHLAVWLYRLQEWPPSVVAEDLVERFASDFHLTKEELSYLYDTALPFELDRSELFTERMITWRELKTVTGVPPDAGPEEGGTLTYLEVRGVGPLARAELSLGERLNLVTGDNGLGKTFLLECAWWALTGQWAGLPANPSKPARMGQARIVFEISPESGRAERVTAQFSWQNQTWPTRRQRPTIPGLLIYAQVDGSFAVWDPARELWATPGNLRESSTSSSLLITKEQVWDGLDERRAGKTRTVINGLIRDWILWQSNPDRHPFVTFKRVLRKLSPTDLGPLEPGEPTRLPGDARDIPTVRHIYGEVPILHAAAGVRRIMALAYLIVWAWREHQLQSELLKRKPQRRMVIMIDEIEAHLHPKWQRSILPAIVGLGDELSAELKVQLLVATHSPLIMASSESLFDSNTDRLFRFSIQDGGRKAPGVVLEEIDFLRQGRIDNWLTSEVFDLKHARSQEAERAIEAAKGLQMAAQPDPEDVREVTEQLLRLLPADDDFWPRWKYFAEQKGIAL